ncbi:hypothetical protein [Demequina sp. NBRC 110051]|nr:hypothetical protein [Demequina sp. NBRC 110051]
MSGWQGFVARWRAWRRERALAWSREVAPSPARRERRVPLRWS